MSEKCVEANCGNYAKQEKKQLRNSEISIEDIACKVDSSEVDFELLLHYLDEPHTTKAA